MSLKEEFPKIINAIDEDFDELRFLIVVDENYGDVDSDEFDAIDPEDYNFLVYITPRVQEVLGEEKMNQLIEKLQNHDKFDDFYMSDVDIYGIQCDGFDEESLSKEILTFIDGLL
jgi:hypothetical protein